ncbi:MAG TPA: TonB family protein [Candidatus Acidoferrales bacterium]|nr:TonB family protein [Candidatus Acidoferrales bacterium]
MRWRIAVGMIACMALLAPVAFAQGQKQQTDTAKQGAPPSAPDRIPIVDYVAVANLVHKVQPVYPPIAKTAHIQGTVVLHVLIAKDGSVKHLTFVSGPPLLMRAAMDAVTQWRYKPTLLNGNPVEVDTTITIVFNLSHEPAAGAPPFEEIYLTDGTKVFGKVAAVNGNMFEVQTGRNHKRTIRRSDIFSITFAENSPPSWYFPAEPTSRATVEQSVSGHTYTNRTAHFVVTVPDGWRKSDQGAQMFPNSVGVLVGPNPSAVIGFESFPPGSTAEEFAHVIQSTFMSGFKDYRPSSEGPVRIDGRDCYTFAFHATVMVGNVHVEGKLPDTKVATATTGLVAIVPLRDRTLMIMCFAPDAIFDKFASAFRGIIASFHSTAPKPEPASTPKH